MLLFSGPTAPLHGLSSILLLGLFLGHAIQFKTDPFDIKKKHNTQFEEIYMVLERSQVDMLFADSGKCPVPENVELFTKKAIHKKHLSKIFSPLHEQDGGSCLRHLDPKRFVQEISSKVNRLETPGLQAVQESCTIWTCLVSKEGLFNLDQTNASLIKAGGLLRPAGGLLGLPGRFLQPTGRLLGTRWSNVRAWSSISNVSSCYYTETSSHSSNKK
ncbi:uncharacterized protein VP01_1446g4 [Puccinia sorghi]|uniref:Uncharacterized protein n=1 Tax=Puccinia sorghi TaxID=27349 RepID=A0A0L6VM02_9BASI|nr:uncharacterized protein VP01_1446g4 [Puccinia sorghi]